MISDKSSKIYKTLRIKIQKVFKNTFKSPQIAKYNSYIQKR